VIEISGADGMPINLLCNFERVHHPPCGRQGGGPGGAGRVGLLSGRKIRPKGRQTVPPGDTIRLELPGGGGHGAPARRDPALVAADVADGLISAHSAEQDYGVVLSPDGAVDPDATRRARSAGPG
jgi:N-methylhydantoinase B/oxoprolinase/acetone carboxylase alpha subunit